MKSWRMVTVLLLCLVLAGSVACSPLGGSNQEEASQQLVKVERGDIVQSVSADGNLSLPWHRKLTFGSSGEIAEINVEEGDRVAQGAVLARLDITSWEQTIKAAEQVVKTAELAVKTGEQAVKTGEQTVKSGELAVKIAEIDFGVAEKNLELATDNFRKITYPYTYTTFVFSVPEAITSIDDAQRQLTGAEEALEMGLSFEQYWEVKNQLEQAQDNLEEARALLNRGQGADVFGSGIVPIQDFWTLRAAQLGMEEAQLQVGKAQLTSEKTKNDLEKTRNDLEKTKNDLEKAKIDVVKANIDLDKAEKELEKAVIVAPFDGVIAAVEVKAGDKLSSVDYATKVIMELIDPGSIELKAEVDEIDIPGIKLGQQAAIEVDALPSLQLEGTVTSVRPLSREDAGLILYEIKVSFEAPDGSGLKEGMTATADIIMNERSNILLVPDRAIEQDSQGNTIVKVMVEEQIEERPVTIGISDGLWTEIIDGLSEGETVVVESRAATGTPAPGLFGG